jgi:hypothetical protein
VGDLEAGTLVSVESSVEYHSFHARILTGGPESGHRTVSGAGQKEDRGGGGHHREHLPQALRGQARRFPKSLEILFKKK